LNKKSKNSIISINKGDVLFKNELTLFQKSKESIWTNEHISKTLLEAQLDESMNAGSRKPKNREIIVNWINKNIKPSSRIIDLGCGPGLYSYDLGKLGHYVFGINFNKASYEKKKKNKTIENLIEYKYCDYLIDTFTGKFNLAIMIFCDFGVLIPNDQIVLMNKIKNILDDDGIFIFDVFGLSAMENINETRHWTISHGNDFWSNEPYLLNTEIKKYEDVNTIGTRYYLINQNTGKINEFILWDQYYNEKSINKLMEDNGFNVIEINNKLINYEKETLLVMAKRRCKKQKPAHNKR
jgi:SAM-dependent methyltransferase